MLYINGVQKAGTHALEKAAQLLGVWPTECDHWFPGDLPEDATSLFAIRHPKNMAVSYVRFANNGVVPSGMLMGYFSQMIELVHQNAAWLNHPTTLVVDTEKLQQNDAEFRRIAEFLAIPMLDDAFENLQGGTVTWNKVKSNWRDHWNDTIQTRWEQEGGLEVEALYGY